jgi:ubiquinone/menaquinone biosynthesis C-methylase UbiE
MDKFEKSFGDNYITADIESPLAKVKMDIHEIPFEDESFSVVMCNHVLEHVDDDLLAMREIHRVLKPGGWAILQVPFFPPLPEITEEDLSIKNPKERERRFGQDDHVRKYGKDYADRLRRSGFKVIEANPTSEMSDADVKHLALPKGEIIYHCIKP